jgi:Protein of unknown function (DUF2934)
MAIVFEQPKSPMTEDSSSSTDRSYVDQEAEIAALAYRFYEEEGRPEGRASDHWLRAEREIRKESQPASLNPTQAEQVFGDHGGER